MKERRYPKTKEVAMKLVVDTIRRGLTPDRAFDACLEGGLEWNRYVAANVYQAALDDDALMRQLLRYINVDMAREEFDELFPLLAVNGASC